MSESISYPKIRNDLLAPPGINHYDKPENFVLAPIGMSCVNAYHALYTYPLEQLRQKSLREEISLKVLKGLNHQIMTETLTLQVITDLFTSRTFFNDSYYHYAGDFEEFPKIYVKDYNDHFGEFSQKDSDKKPVALIALEAYHQKPNMEKIDPFDLHDFDRLTESQREFRAKMDGIEFEKLPSTTSELIKDKLSQLIPEYAGDAFIKNIDEDKIQKIQDEMIKPQNHSLPINTNSPQRQESNTNQNFKSEESFTSQPSEDASTYEKNATEEAEEAGQEQQTATPSFSSEVESTSQTIPLKKEESEAKQENKETGEDVFANYRQRQTQKKRKDQIQKNIHDHMAAQNRRYKQTLNAAATPVKKK